MSTSSEISFSPPRLTHVLSLTSVIVCETGLRIGAAESSIAIGGIDNPVIRNPLTGEPYIPGSSLKGKMRSLLERRYELPQNWSIQRDRVNVHVCEEEAEYRECPVCPLFGIAAPQQGQWFCLTRLRVADVPLTDQSRERLEQRSTDFPFTEVKTEIALDRLTSGATPRSMERVPAGAEFGPARLTLFVYKGEAQSGDSPQGLLKRLLEGMELVEADYLGSAGSRGSGRISFTDIALELLTFPREGGLADRKLIGKYRTLANLLGDIEELDLPE